MQTPPAMIPLGNTEKALEAFLPEEPASRPAPMWVRTDVLSVPTAPTPVVPAAESPAPSPAPSAASAASAASASSVPSPPVESLASWARGVCSAYAWTAARFALTRAQRLHPLDGVIALLALLVVVTNAAPWLSSTASAPTREEATPLSDLLSSPLDPPKVTRPPVDVGMLSQPLVEPAVAVAGSEPVAARREPASVAPPAATQPRAPRPAPPVATARPDVSASAARTAAALRVPGVGPVPTPARAAAPVDGNDRRDPDRNDAEEGPVPAGLSAPSATSAAGPAGAEAGTAGTAPPVAGTGPPAAGSPVAPAGSPLTPARPAAVSAAPAPAARPALVDVDRTAVRGALADYRQAFNTLDVGAAQSVWPTVNARTLDRAFERLDEQELSFDDCRIDVAGERATAICTGSARYVARVGNRSPRVEPRRWDFSLRKAGEAWLIAQVDVR
jgi:hypothetical protein